MRYDLELKCAERLDRSWAGGGWGEAGAGGEAGGEAGAGHTCFSFGCFDRSNFLI